MTEFIAFCVGLIVGWNFLAQPEWVKDMVNKVKERINNNDKA